MNTDEIKVPKAVILEAQREKAKKKSEGLRPSSSGYPTYYEAFSQVKMVLDRRTMEKYTDVEGGKLMKIPKHFAPVTVHAVYLKDGRRWDVVNGINSMAREILNEQR